MSRGGAPRREDAARPEPAGTALGAEEPLATSILDSLEAPTAVLDAAGVIRAVNRSWTAGAARDGADPEAVAPGASYLEACDRAHGPFSAQAAAVGDGIRSVLRGEAARFAAEYPCPDGTRERWFTVRVTPLPDPAGGAVVTHIDVTGVREATGDSTLERDRTVAPGEAPGRLLLDRQGFVLADPSTADGHVGAPNTALRLGSFLDRVHPVDVSRARDTFEAVGSQPGRRRNVRLRVGHRRTGWRQVDIVLTNHLEDPEVRAVTAVLTDITEHRRAALTQQFGTTLLERLPSAVTVLDDAGLVVFWNERAAELYGAPASTVLDRELGDIGFGPTEPEREASILSALAAGHRWDGDYDVVRPDGVAVPAYVSFVPLRLPELDFTGVIATSVDISEQRALEYRLEHLALHDHLTGLPNRVLFLDRLDTALTRSRREGSPVGVLFIDLDGFKQVNDRFGHAAGDEVLQAVARLLESVLREGDTLARIAGDEFVVCAEHLAAPSDAIDLAERMLAAIGSSFGRSGQQITLTASIGIALSRPGMDADSVLRDADTAMYRAKRTGKSRVELFDEALRRQIHVRRRLEEELDRAVRHDELLLHFQPVVELATGSVVSAEALLRWDHPVLGLVGPERFIPAADRAGLARTVGAQALRHACAAAVRWQTRLPGRALALSVNISARHFAERSLVVQLARVLDHHGLDPSLLTVEVAEPVLVTDVDASAKVVGELARLGVRIAVDDVGTGPSSMTYLKHLPVHSLKIDGTLVRRLGHDEEDLVIVSAIVELASLRGLEVVAEGVESVEQLQVVTELGCARAQGYLLGRPVDEEGLVTSLAAPRPGAGDR